MTPLFLALAVAGLLFFTSKKKPSSGSTAAAHDGMKPPHDQITYVALEQVVGPQWLVFEMPGQHQDGSSGGYAVSNANFADAVFDPNGIDAILHGHFVSNWEDFVLRKTQPSAGNAGQPASVLIADDAFYIRPDDPTVRAYRVFTSDAIHSEGTLTTVEVIV